MNNSVAGRGVLGRAAAATLRGGRPSCYLLRISAGIMALCLTGFTTVLAQDPFEPIELRFRGRDPQQNAAVRRPLHSLWSSS